MCIDGKNAKKKKKHPAARSNYLTSYTCRKLYSNHPKYSSNTKLLGAIDAIDAAEG